jgi:outer membrane protein
MNRFFSTSLLLAGASTGVAFAQTLPAQPAPASPPTALTLSLAQAREEGVRNRFDVKANQYNITAAELDIKRSRQAWLPDVRATGNVRYNPQLQATLIPAGFVGLNEPSLLALGARSISVYSLELAQPILDPTRRTDVSLARATLASEQERVRGQEIAIKDQISQAYLNVVLRRLQDRIARRQEQRFQEYLTLTEGRFTNGVLIENDLLRARLDYQNAHVQATTSAQDYQLSLVTLRYRLNVPPSTTLTLTDTLVATNQVLPLAADPAVVGNRTEVKQLQLEQASNTLQELRQRQATRPTLALVGNYSAQYLNADFNYNYTDGKWWSPFNSIGLQLALPLTRQFTNRTLVQQTTVRSQQTAVRLQQQQLDVSYEIEHAAREVNNAQENLQLTQRAYDLSQQVYRNQQQQYALGALQYDDLLTTERSLLSTEQNYVSATYSYLASKLNYEVAIGAL